MAAEFGAVADVAGRLNFVTEDVYAEEVLPMIIKAKTALGWSPRIGFKALLREMARSDLELVRAQSELIVDAFFEAVIMTAWRVYHHASWRELP